MEERVYFNIVKVIVSGFSVEKFLRNVCSFGWFGNIFFGGMDVSSFLFICFSVVIIICFVVFILVYLIIVVFIVVKVMYY